jgi:heme-degrading monooxygenase HmoA
MSQIRENSGICTMIMVIKLDPANQDEIADVLLERARLMAKQPGFISLNLHRSKDGSHIVNYVQWANAAQFAAARTAAEFDKRWSRFGQLVKAADSGLYDVVHVAAA